METVSAITASMRAVAPAGQRRLGDEVLAELGELTRALIAARAGAAGYSRPSRITPPA